MNKVNNNVTKTCVCVCARCFIPSLSYLVFLDVGLHDIRAHCFLDLVLVLLDDVLHEGDPAHQLSDGVTRRQFLHLKLSGTNRQQS